MKENILYNKPAIEIIDIEVESVLASSPNTMTVDDNATHGGGMSRSKRGGLWDNE